MCRMRVLLIALAALFTSGTNSYAAEKQVAASGKTQVVAKLNNREITISDLRSEMVRLGFSPNNPAGEPIALKSIISRALLADAARDARLHRQPAALREMATASEKALADMYLATVSQPPEPTREEIEDYIAARPGLFAKRRVYTFSVLTLPTNIFDDANLTPLFDESVDFEVVAARLRRDRVRYSVTPAVQPSDAFPEPIRKQLGQYGLNDNIVIRADDATQIMKITAIDNAPITSQDAPAIARQIMLAERSEKRASTILASLKQKTKVAYYRQSAVPAENE